VPPTTASTSTAGEAGTGGAGGLPLRLALMLQQLKQLSSG
jgi:hypothetical protein